MAERQETSADIIAKMRDYSNDCNDGYHTDYGVVCTDMRNYADRLEAARKRELATAKKSLVVGDAAKLREALLRCDAIAQLPEVRNEQSIKDMRNIIRQALSAPPRNCDRFGTFAQAKAEWWKTEVLPRVEGVVGGEEPPFEEWLFLPATEQKGENNANK